MTASAFFSTDFIFVELAMFSLLIKKYMTFKLYSAYPELSTIVQLMDMLFLLKFSVFIYNLLTPLVGLQYWNQIL